MIDIPPYRKPLVSISLHCESHLAAAWNFIETAINHTKHLLIALTFLGGASRTRRHSRVLRFESRQNSRFLFVSLLLLIFQQHRFWTPVFFRSQLSNQRCKKKKKCGTKAPHLTPAWQSSNFPKNKALHFNAAPISSGFRRTIAFEKWPGDNVNLAWFIDNGALLQFSIALS